MNNTMTNLNRRRFLKTTLGSTVAIGLWPALSWRARGANEDIRVAVVGFNGRGGDHINGLRRVKGVRLVALCDVDSDVLGREVKRCQDRAEPVQGYADLRRLLESPEIDAVSIATPNHWHSLAAIWAIQAGKDVYVEKPVSHEVWEGRQLVTAARTHGRIVQAGTQSRSSANIAQAIQWVREGNVGKIRCARGLCYKPRKSIGKTEGPQPIPPSVDYDLWCGPAPNDPLRRKHLHYDWHWVWPTGNGDIGNQGIHQMDLARWVLGESALSPRILSIGGRLGYTDDGTTPNTQVVLHDYSAAPLFFEVRGLPAADGAQEMDKFHGASIGVVVECEGGWMVIPDDANSAIIQDRDGNEIKRFAAKADHGADHYANFINAVRSRKHTDLKADILEGHLSSALCHTGNISYRLGRTHSIEEIRDALKTRPGMAEALGRMEEHLAANHVDLVKTPATLGLPLQMDPVKERFIGNSDANQWLTRQYRDPFVVPSAV